MRRLGASALLLVVMLGTIELVTRFDDWARFAVPFDSNTLSMNELLVTDSLGTHARANTQFRQFRINGMGFRGPEISPSQLAASRLVIVSGASESFGLYESPNREWPRQLDDSLRAQCRTPTVVANAAFAGMSLPTVEQDIRLRLARLHPVVIAYYPTPMQYLEAKPPKAAAPARQSEPVDAEFHLRSLDRFREAVKRVVPALVLDWLRARDIRASRAAMSTAPLTQAPSERLDLFEQDLRRLVGTVRAVGATPALIVHQNRFQIRSGADQERWLRAWERFYPRFTGDAILEFDRLAAERTRRVASDSGIVLVDPTAVLARETPPPFADFSHFTDRGSAIVAGLAARAIAPRTCAE